MRNIFFAAMLTAFTLAATPLAAQTMERSYALSMENAAATPAVLEAISNSRIYLGLVIPSSSTEPHSGNWWTIAEGTWRQEQTLRAASPLNDTLEVSFTPTGTNPFGQKVTEVRLRFWVNDSIVHGTCGIVYPGFEAPSHSKPLSFVLEGSAPALWGQWWDYGQQPLSDEVPNFYLLLRQ